MWREVVNATGMRSCAASASPDSVEVPLKNRLQNRFQGGTFLNIGMDCPSAHVLPTRRIAMTCLFSSRSRPEGDRRPFF
jgi:hypothetical protein